MAEIKWDSNGFVIDGSSAHLVSGEFHYFRVPHEEWVRRMRLFKEAGGNCIATYVPWIIHEPDEGNILFGDCPGRDLKSFLEKAQAEGLMVILRPGPYQYSELIGDGLPRWLFENYPELQAKNIHGESFRESSISYLHPVFLEKARRYFQAFAEVARPFMAENGGPVCMTQVDNELAGIHVWFGSKDYNAETMGFGREDGRYPRWLEQKYGSIEKLNDAYGCDFENFASVKPIEEGAPRDLHESRRMRDYSDFYFATIAEYASTLVSWLREDGINTPICHNAGSPTMDTMLKETVDTLGDGFLLGSDHYYALNPYWPQNNPTPQYMLRCCTSCGLLKAMGMPPTVFELPGGMLCDAPPVFREDLFACYMANAAMGMKGLNYYIFTGGPNFPGTCACSTIYDYHAPVSAEGEVRETYYALKDFGEFLKENSWLQRAQRATPVQLGFMWENTRSQKLAPPVGLMSSYDAWDMTEFGVEYAMLTGGCATELRPLTGELDIARPLIVVCPSCMSRAGQQAIIDFVENGGNVILMPVLPEYDENGKPETLLCDYVGIKNIHPIKNPGTCIRMDGSEDVYMTDPYTADIPEDAVALAWDEHSNEVIGAEVKRGNGRIIWMGAQFRYQMTCSATMMESLVKRLGAKPALECSNRNIFTALWSDGERRMLFVMNLYTASQSAHIRVFDGGKTDVGEVKLSGMEVKTILL